VIPDPLFVHCARSFPERPTIDVAETPWTREELDARIDYWMWQIPAAREWAK